MKKIIIPAILLGFYINTANSGVHSTTAHSRANCVNNESITWWLGHAYDWKVVSIHMTVHGGREHAIDTGYANTWRQAAVHWGEAPTGNEWVVQGYHYLLQYGKGKVPFETTYVVDCSIYDGWWDH